MTAKRIKNFKFPGGSDERDGNFLDTMGCCKLCDGEIPAGHTEDCDLWKKEKENLKLRQELLALKNIPKVRYTHAYGLPANEYSRIQHHNLFKLGDCIPVWVREGDILAAGEFVLGSDPDDDRDGLECRHPHSPMACTKSMRKYVSTNDGIYVICETCSASKFNPYKKV